jgi:hypothetical protein
MLKIKNGIIIQGRFDNAENGLVKLVREAAFSTIIIHLSCVVQMEHKKNI